MFYLFCSIIKGIELGLLLHIMSRQNWHKNMIVLFIMLYIINPYLIWTFKTMNKHYCWIICIAIFQNTHFKSPALLTQISI